MGVSMVGALARRGVRRRGGVVMTCVMIVFSCAAMPPGYAAADPLDPPGRDEVAPRLPVIVPAASNWQPKFPVPYDQTRHEVTDVEINAERELCQWYNPQYAALRLQIERFNNSLVRGNGDYAAPGVQEKADAVTANIDQSMEFLTPRVQTFTRNQDHANDIYFPLYQAESFYRLWEQLSNVGAGIHGRQPTWFVGPSFQRMMRFGSRIGRSHVCD